MNEYQPPHRGHEADRLADRSQPMHGWHPSMGPAADRFLSTWDAPPRDGPAVFIADLATHDLLGAMRGRWIDPSQPPEELRQQIAEVVGEDGVDTGRWGVLDQVAAGTEMVPEHLSVAGLAHWFRSHHPSDPQPSAEPGSTRPARMLRAIGSRYTFGNGAES